MPKLNDKRDADLLYHSVGQPEQHPRTWMTSQEYQIQEGDYRYFWRVGNTRIDTPSGKSESPIRLFKLKKVNTIDLAPICFK